MLQHHGIGKVLKGQDNLPVLSQDQSSLSVQSKTTGEDPVNLLLSIVYGERGYPLLTEGKLRWGVEDCPLIRRNIEATPNWDSILYSADTIAAACTASR